MPEIKLGTAILFLIPGLLAYCGLFGIFASKSQLTVAPAAPAANSIKTLTIILVASMVMHGATAILIGLNAALCAYGRCVLTLSDDYHDFYRLVARLARSGDGSAGDLAYVIIVAFAQGAVAYLLIRAWLKWCAGRDQLPDWLYGWSTEIANKVDDEGRVLLAYVLTTIDVDKRTVVYAGPVRDIALLPDGRIARITLVECERYLIDLRQKWTTVDAEPLALFDIVTLESDTVRNIAFETIYAGPIEPAFAEAEEQAGAR